MNPANLKPPREQDIAQVGHRTKHSFVSFCNQVLRLFDCFFIQEIIALSGGVMNVVNRAVQSANEGKFDIACTLIQYAVDASPNNAEVLRTHADIYDRRAEFPHT